MFDATLRIYAHGGWASLAVEKVARESGVGKAAIYRRWDGPATLMHEAFRSRWTWLGEIDGGSLTDDLSVLALRVFQLYSGPMGEVAFQLRVDGRRHEEVRLLADATREEAVELGRALVRRAISRGELAGRATPSIVMDLLMGAIVNHVATTPPRLWDRMLEESRQFLDDIVQVIVRGLAAP